MGYSRDTHGVLTRSVQRLGYGVVNLEEEAMEYLGYSRVLAWYQEGVLTGYSLQRLGYGVVNLEEEAKKDDENIEELENAQVRGYPPEYPVSTPRVPVQHTSVP
jgi:hypothetical protein